MNTRKNRVFLLLAIAMSSICARPQTAPANGPGTPVTISGKHAGLDGFEMYTQGEPFELLQRQTAERTGRDGIKRTSESATHAFRDSQGRFRLESGRMKDGLFEATFITIFDPVALTSVAFGAHGTTGRLTQIEPRHLPTAEDERKAAEQAARSLAYDRDHPEDFSEEALGTRTIAGQQAIGTRKKQLFVSTNGKDRFRRVAETWASPELKINLLTVTDDDDPRLGTVTTEVTELKRTEPDPELFKVPANLTIEIQMRH